ncbi:hypothetical protein BKA67DRAFT_668734, partial [Truncatella angustata]
MGYESVKDMRGAPPSLNSCFWIARHKVESSRQAVVWRMGVARSIASATPVPTPMYNNLYIKIKHCIIHKLPHTTGTVNLRTQLAVLQHQPLHAQAYLPEYMYLPSTTRSIMLILRLLGSLRQCLAIIPPPPPPAPQARFQRSAPRTRPGPGRGRWRCGGVLFARPGTRERKGGGSVGSGAGCVGTSLLGRSVDTYSVGLVSAGERGGFFCVFLFTFIKMKRRSTDGTNCGWEFLYVEKYL